VLSQQRSGALLLMTNASDSKEKKKGIYTGVSSQSSSLGGKF